MPEIKNTFLAGKMNKDLDERLVPKGEYREALNVQISKSEGSDSGVIHNIKGNIRLDDATDLGVSKVIGSVFDDQKNEFYFFITNTTTKTTAAKAVTGLGNNQITLDSIDGIVVGDIIYGLDPDLIDHVEVSSIDTVNNRVSIVFNPQGPNATVPVTTTVLKNTKLSFSEDNTKINQVRKLKIGESQSTIIIENDFLNFDRTKRIQANIIENYLFFTDNVNEPKKLDLTKTYNSSTKESEITVAKIAPLFAPKLASMTNDSEIDEDYLERKFARFAYRYKFEDNTYSVLSPFSIIAFDIEGGSSTYSATVMNEIAHAGLNKNVINKNNQFTFYIYTPDTYDTFSDARIEEVEIVMKTTDSSVLYSVDTITVDDISSYGTDSDVSQKYYSFIYKSKKPKKILPESILLRVYDDVPIKALAQEIVGNRVVYGNYTKNLDLSTVSNKKLNYTIDLSSFNTIHRLGVKQYRNYDVGIVLFDEFGRTSPVILSENSTIRVPGASDYNDLVNNNRILRITFTDSAQITDLIENTKFKYYSVVVKQTEQQYYNIYTPGIGAYLGESYFPLVADSINKIPLSVDQQASNAGIYSTEEVIYPVLINQSTFVQTSGDGTNTIVAAEGYEITNNLATNGDLDNFTSTDYQEYTRGGITGQNKLTLTSDFNDPYLGTIARAKGVGVIVYIKGIKIPTTTYNPTTSEIQFNEDELDGTDGLPVFDNQDDVKVFLTASNISFPASIDRYAYSLTVPSSSASNLVIQDAGDHISVVVGSVISTDPNDYTYTITEADSTVPSEFERLTITGIGKASDLSTIPQEVLNASSEARRTGIYKANVNTTYVAVEGEYGPYYSSFNDDNEFKGLKQDLAVFETKPFESSLDIYYETATQGRLSDITTGSAIEIEYYNCLNVRMFSSAYVQESRIEGGFNEPYIDNGITGYVVDNDYEQINRPASIIYSGIINTRTGVDNSNQFPLLEDITRSIDPSNGSIQKLYADTDDLLILQEEKVSRALIDKDIIYTAEGQGLTAAGARVISQINGYATNYGIGKNPESFAVYAGRKYFTDKPKGVVLRLSRDGMTEISNYGMRSFFRNTLSDATDVVGMWDIYNKEYVLSVTKPADSYTIGFDESVNGWSSFYSYLTSEAGGSIDSNFYTFKDAKIYKHYSSSNQNEFYGVANYDSYVELVMNENPSVSKNFNTVNYEGSDTWNISNIETDTDQAENVAAFNINNQDNIISGFKKMHNKYYSSLFNKTQASPNEVIFGEDVSGIKGFFAKMKIKTNDTSYKELYSVSSNYNVNSY